MTPVLISGPAVEPLSLPAARNWLRVDHADDDVLILALITSARLIVEAHTRLSLIRQSWRLVLDHWPACNDLEVPLRPLISLDAIRVATSSTESVTIPPQDYQTAQTPLAPRLHFLKSPPQPATTLSGIEIDVTTGFGLADTDVPAELAQVIRLLVAHWYENRGDAAGAEKTWPAEIRTLIAPWRPVRLV